MPVEEPIAYFPRPGVPPDVGQVPGAIMLSWIKFLTNRNNVIAAAPSGVATIEKADQDASIGTTTIQVGTTVSGYYRISYHAQIVQAATTSSSLTVTFGFTRRGATLSASGAAITGNSLTTFQPGSLPVFRVDTATTITYATTYASVGATPMKYDLYVKVEQVP